MTQTMDAVKLTCTTCGQGNRVPLARLEQGPKCGSCGEALVDGRVHELDAASHDKVTRGDGLPVRLDRMFLHARRLRFHHPHDGREITVEAPWPKECEDIAAVSAR